MRHRLQEILLASIVITFLLIVGLGTICELIDMYTGIFLTPALVFVLSLVLVSELTASAIVMVLID